MPRACYVYYMAFNNSALLYREAKTLKEAGFEIDIISLRNTKNEKFLENFQELNLYKIQKRSNAEKKIFFYFFRLGLFFIKAFILVSILGLIKRYKIVHVTSPPDLMVFTAVIPKFFGAKIILDIHDIGPELYMRKLHLDESKPIIRLLKLIEKWAAAYSDHVFTVTNFWRERLINRSAPKQKCTVLLNVPDNSLFEIINRTSLKSNNSFNLFYHGSLEEHFGVDTLIKAMVIINDQYPSLKLHIYGEGRLRQQLISYAHHLKLSNTINFSKRVPFYKLPQILQSAEIGIVPTKDSVFSEETISMKSLEYISLGIPVVISSTKAHRFYFNDSIVKFFEPGNEAELAKGVISLYTNEQERIQLIRNSQNFIQKHSWKNCKKVYLNIIDRLI